MLTKIMHIVVNIVSIREARYLMGENLKVVWAEFSTLSLLNIAILCGKCTALHAATSTVKNSAQCLSCQLMFDHDLYLHLQY
jgi:hypothetical protein